MSVKWESLRKSGHSGTPAPCECHHVHRSTCTPKKLSARKRATRQLDTHICPHGLLGTHSHWLVITPIPPAPPTALIRPDFLQLSPMTEVTVYFKIRSQAHHRPHDPK